MTTRTTSSRTLVLLAAHGAGDGSRANQRVRELTAALSAARRDLRVAAAFNLGSPRVSEVLEREQPEHAVVLPLMTSDGYFAGEYLRGQITREHVHVLPPIGTRVEVAELLVRRVREGLARHGFAAEHTHVLVVGHGTRRSSTSAAATAAVATAIRHATPGGDVQSAFLDQEPLLEAVAQTLTRPNVLALPFLIGGGDHAMHDIPERLAHAHGMRVHVLDALGEDPELASLVLRAVDDAATRPALRLGTRSSRLALWQAARAVEQLESAGARVRIVEFSTDGDRDQRSALEDFSTDGPFTDELERELLSGAIDAAVHSCKDLPLEDSPGTRIGAYLRRGSTLEALVSRDGVGLRELPRGAKVGTCSARRAAQVKRLRPDLTLVPIRGDVEARLRKVERGEVDATVLALAGLERLGLADRAAGVLGFEEMAPEAGQGAIVLQVRSADAQPASVIGAVVAAVDDAETRLSVEEERRFTALIAAQTELIAGAAMEHGVLRGRALSAGGRVRVDVEAGSAEDAAALALEQLRNRGSVALVGAGPGDAGLITVRGLELLRRAEVVVYDRLVGRSLLAEAPADAEMIDAGKAAGRHTLTQEEINAILVQRGRAGWRVVRLKGGDPFVFGRGWEELVACRGAGIRCEVVPGVSSAIAAPAAAGVPVTARGVARTFAVVTPQVESGAEAVELNYEALARLDTVSVLMGRGMLQEVAAGFMGAGRTPSTPVAVIQDGTLPNQRVVRGELATIAHLADEAEIGTPAVVVIGEVAGLDGGAGGAVRGRLHGKRIVVTRPHSASAGLIGMLRDEGAVVIDCPLIRIAYIPASNAGVLGERFDWTVFTSLHAVRGLWRALEERGLDARALAGSRIAAVGPKTAAELVGIGLRPDVVPTVHRASALIDEIAGTGESMGQRALFPCGTLARDELRVGLRRRGMHVEELAVYDTLDEAPSAAARQEIEAGVDAVLFYCPSAVRSAVHAGLNFGGAAIACIGPTTADAARDAGWAPEVVPGTHTDEGLIDALIKHLAAHESPVEVRA